jgi:hypothetical protein
VNSLYSGRVLLGVVGEARSRSGWSRSANNGDSWIILGARFEGVRCAIEMFGKEKCRVGEMMRSELSSSLAPQDSHVMTVAQWESMATGAVHIVSPRNFWEIWWCREKSSFRSNVGSFVRLTRENT